MILGGALRNESKAVLCYVKSLTALGLLSVSKTVLL